MAKSVGNIVFGVACVIAGLTGCAGGQAVETQRVVPTPQMLETHCEESVGEARVERFEFEGGVEVYVAIGYDLANTILIHTPEGNVIVDAMSGPNRAGAARDALLAQAPGETKALIFTHSHIDHVGGGTVWAPLEGEVPVWATEAFSGHFFKQYGVFQAAERDRGRRQFGDRVSEANLPCSALGANIDFASGIGEGLRLPTQTFTGKASIEVGGVTIELHEAHGETDDQLFVWLPEQRVLMPGDNIYRTFPNLYTIRGTRPRPVDAWIDSLDHMRRLEPTLLLGSHTIPVQGEATVADVLRDYRDAIAFVRATVVRGANAGLSRDAIASGVELPAHLVDSPWLRELYGQLDWSARSIYDAELGWFDGRPETLYPLPPADLARREVELMGGPRAVLDAARAEGQDPRFALHLLAKLERSGLLEDGEVAEPEAFTLERAEALRAVAAEVANTNGRGYLLEFALELEAGPGENFTPELSDEFLRELPVDLFFDAMPVRLRLDMAGEVEECLALELSDVNRKVWITVRRGVAEIAWDAPLPGTPEPIATVTTDSLTWKRVALRLDTSAQAVSSGRLKIDGPAMQVAAFFDRFDRGL